jgi:site-specific DNA recombinase
VNVAVYARKSTSQEKATEEAKSVTRQIELARAFAERQEWIVRPELVYVDDGISGGIFDPKQRPGLAALLDAARAKPRLFDALVIMNQSRLARRQRYAVDIVHDLTDAGVRIFHYQTGLERKMETATDRFMVSVDGFSDESYRESIRITTRETMRRKAERGEVAGGVLFGYGNHRTPTGYVERVINDQQAAVIRRIFQMTVDGYGLVRIAKAFSDEAIPSPTGRPTGWAPSAIRAMLYNEHYRGVVVYGRTRWEDRGERKVKVKVPREQWVRIEKPDLRIIPESLWLAAHERIRKTRKAYLRTTNGRLWGRPETGIESPYLLGGLALDSTCGGSLGVWKHPDGRNRHRVYTYYACSYHRLRGDKVCSNALRMPMESADSAVIDVLREDILNPEALRLAVEIATDRYGNRSGDVAQQRANVEADLRRIEAEISRLVEALATGQPLVSVQDAIRVRERRRAELRAHLEHLDGLAKQPRLDPTRLQQELARRLTEWRELLNAEPVKARQIVRKLLEGRLVFEPQPETGVYTFTGKASYGRLLSGVVQNVWCPRGDSNTRHAV